VLLAVQSRLSRQPEGVFAVGTQTPCSREHCDNTLIIYINMKEDCNYVTSSLLNGSSDRKTDYTIVFVRVQGWFMG